MKLLYDFFPIIIFFIAYQQYGIFVATGVAIAAAFLQVSLYWLKYRRVERMHLISLALIAVLGGLTLLLRDNTFIMWKPTVVNWLFAAAFLGSHWIGNKPLVQRMLDQQIELPAQVWQRLNISWVVFFFASGLLNIYVAYTFSEATWVNFKLFGLLGLTLVFLVAQGIYLANYISHTENADSDTEAS